MAEHIIDHGPDDVLVASERAADALLVAVEGLRAALPPERLGASAVAAAGPSRETALAALTSLAAATDTVAALPLHPVQFDVIFRFKIKLRNGTDNTKLNVATLVRSDRYILCSGHRHTSMNGFELFLYRT